MRPAFQSLFIVAAACTAGCSARDGDFPSLAPRASEQIDPRLPVERPLNERPVSASLSARLESLIASARSGEPGFEAAIGNARRAAESAGPAESESWVVAQEALSAAVAAREPAAMALGEIDTISAELLLAQGGLAPSDLSAIQNAAAIIAAISRRQADAIAEVQARLAG